MCVRVIRFYLVIGLSKTRRTKSEILISQLERDPLSTRIAHHCHWLGHRDVIVYTGNIVFGIGHCHGAVASRQTALAAAKFRANYFSTAFDDRVAATSSPPSRGRAARAPRWTRNWVPGKTGRPSAQKNSSKLYAHVRAPLHIALKPVITHRNGATTVLAGEANKRSTDCCKLFAVSARQIRRL